MMYYGSCYKREPFSKRGLLRLIKGVYFTFQMHTKYEFFFKKVNVPFYYKTHTTFSFSFCYFLEVVIKGKMCGTSLDNIVPYRLLQLYVRILHVCVVLAILYAWRRMSQM